MSGAALFADDLLIGVVVADHQGYGGARLLATRAEALFDEPGFLDAIAMPAGWQGCCRKQGRLLPEAPDPTCAAENHRFCDA
ncbi:hypothetical protein [Nonomuraea sp. NPDC049684]|uniref:hypothetical protein n=1 Tax=Nonomuraea sp. NPDC049684 TaxID=3364356 RepID=UPI0037AF056D